MTADDRLDQLEILLSESMTILDRHTAQLKQLSNSVSQIGTTVAQLSTIAAQQRDNIDFLLKEQMEMKADMAGMNGKLDLLVQLVQNLGKQPRL